MLGKLFCFSGGHSGLDAEWVARSQYGQLVSRGNSRCQRLHQLSGAAREGSNQRLAPVALAQFPLYRLPQARAGAVERVLEVVQEELEERFAALGAAAYRASQDAAHLRRLYKANLPPGELAQCKEILCKLTAIDQARQAAEAVRVGATLAASCRRQQLRRPAAGGTTGPTALHQQPTAHGVRCTGTCVTSLNKYCSLAAACRSKGNCSSS